MQSYRISNVGCWRLKSPNLFGLVSFISPTLKWTKKDCSVLSYLGMLWGPPSLIQFTDIVQNHFITKYIVWRHVWCSVLSHSVAEFKILFWFCLDFYLCFRRHLAFLSWKQKIQLFIPSVKLNFFIFLDCIWRTVECRLRAQSFSYFFDGRSLSRHKQIFFI